MTTYGFKALKPGSSSAAGTAGDGSGASAPGAPLPKQPPSLAAAKADREHTGQWPVMAAEFIGARVLNWKQVLAETLSHDALMEHVPPRR